MAGENKTNLPPGSVDAISKDASADESVKATKWGFQATTSTPNRSNDLKTVSGIVESRGYKVVDMNSEKNGAISMTVVPPDGGVPEIVGADQPLPNSEREIGNKEAIGFLLAPVDPESAGGDNKEKLFKLLNLPSAIEREDVEIEVEKRKLVLKLTTALEEHKVIKRTEELPFDATGSAASTSMEDRNFVVKFAFEKLEPKSKPKSIISKIWGFAKDALIKAGPACVVMGGKKGLDEINDDDPEA